MTVSESRGMKHPRSIAVVNYKGGVCKTTITYLLGLYLALSTGRRALLIDIDAQCSLTLAVGLDPEHQSLSEQNVYSLVAPQAWADIRNITLSQYVRSIPGLAAPLYIIPGGFSVEDLDIEIVESMISDRERSKTEFFLYCRQLIRSLDAYDYVLIDCPPNKMYLTQAMLRASSFFLPVTIPDKISIYGMPRLLRWVNEIGDEERPRMLGYVLNAANRTGGSPGGKVNSQQLAENELQSNLIARLSRFERTMMRNQPCLGSVPRLDAVAKFLGNQKDLQLDFAKQTSGQPTIDACLNGITRNVLERLQAYGEL
jgi:chromosome partitioning protein